MKKITHIFIAIILLLMAGCTGSKKFFKAAEKLEKQGLISDAAEYYYQSLQRKPTNVNARIKLKEVGQKYMSSLASQFFRNYNTQQLEASLESYEKLSDFNSRAAALNVQLDYPKAYDQDYANAVEQYNSKNYNQVATLVGQKKYSEAVTYINKVKKYNASYKNLPQLEIIAVCEPLYQSAVRNIENKNYASAYTLLVSIKGKTDNYKDSQQLLELADAQQNKNVILFQPKVATTPNEKSIEETLFNNFQATQQQLSHVKLINNTPFQNVNNTFDLNNSNNVDLMQAVRKATGADYFYLYDVTDIRQNFSGEKRVPYGGYQEERYKQNDGTFAVKYKQFDYNNVQAQNVFSYTYKYQVVSASSGQIVEGREQYVSAKDVVDYNEFTSPNLVQKLFGKANPSANDINSLFPYNRSQTIILNQYNPSAWRAKFSARTTLKPFEELKGEAVNQTINLFINSNKNLR
ncbi:MAG: hypothetical protein QM820_07535 [Minicystis sp.]